jgi:hypothetical protein
MLDKKGETIYISNPQQWNKYVYALNNPLRYTDPDGLIPIPQWKDLSQEFRDDLAKRLGKDAEKIWNGWDDRQRQGVINLRANLMSLGVWDSITKIAYANLEVGDKLGPTNPTTLTESQTGWYLVFQSNSNIGWDLQQAGMFEESARWNHPEGNTTVKEKGDDIVLHVVLLQAPADAWNAAHWDGGGGSISSAKHREEVSKGTGPSPDDITKHLGNTKARQYLLGVTPNGAIERLIGAPVKNSFGTGDSGKSEVKRKRP